MSSMAHGLSVPDPGSLLSVKNHSCQHRALVDRVWETSVTSVVDQQHWCPCQPIIFPQALLSPSLGYSGAWVTPALASFLDHSCTWLLSPETRAWVLVRGYGEAASSSAPWREASEPLELEASFDQVLIHRSSITRVSRCD